MLLQALFKKWGSDCLGLGDEGPNWVMDKRPEAWGGECHLMSPMSHSAALRERSNRWDTEAGKLLMVLWAALQCEETLQRALWPRAGKGQRLEEVRSVLPTRHPSLRQRAA